MKFLVLAIAASTGNHLLFKAFARFRVDLWSAIVANYAACVLIGCASSQALPFSSSVPAQGWYPFSVLQGGIFVACLFLLGLTTAKQGVAVASLATRLSVALPTAGAFFLYNDPLTAAKVGGIMAALLALYLSGLEPAKSAEAGKASSMLPFALFTMFGAYSILIKYVQERYLDKASYHAYVLAAFFSAFLISGVVLAWRLFGKKQACRWPDLLWGVALGCSNYGSVYFLVRALAVPGWQSSRIFPTVSTAVVVFSSFGAWAFFNERIRRLLLVALVIGAGSIILVNL